MEENITVNKVSNLKNNLAIPIAIVLAGALVAGAIFISNKKAEKVAMVPEVQKADVAIPPVTAEDHILGNPNAELVIVEYSDLQCPYCSDFHKTMEDVMEEYGKKGKVAWVYRHYWAPRTMQDGSIFHPLAGKAGEAAECAAELGGNDKFWAFTNDILASRTTQNEKLSRMPEIAEAAGLDRAAFETCLNSGKYAGAIQKAYDEAKAIGVSGTPTSFIMAKDGIYPLEGFIPSAEMKIIIKDLL